MMTKRRYFAGACGLMLVGMLTLHGTAAPKRKPAAAAVAADSATLAAQRRDLEIGRSMETFFNIFREVNLYYVDTTSPARMVEEAGNAML